MARSKRTTGSTEALSDILPKTMERLQAEPLEKKPRRKGKADPRPLAALEAEQTPVEPSPSAPQPSPDPTPEPESFAAKIKAERPIFHNHEGYRNVARFGDIRVNKNLDRNEASIQFSEERHAGRDEKDYLEALGKADDGRNYKWNSEARQWTRRPPEGMTVGENIIDAVETAKMFAAERAKGRGR